MLAQFAQARSAGLTTRDEDGILLVTDTVSGSDYRLEPIAEAIWRRADGRTAAGELAHQAQEALNEPVELETVWEILDALADAGLLEARVTPPSGSANLSRRSFLRRVGVVGAAFTVAGAAAAVPALATPAQQEQEQKKLNSGGPLGILQDDLTTLQALAGTLGGAKDIVLDAAIDALEVATDATNWVDDKDLSPSRGALVFVALAGATFSLGLISSASSAIPSVIQDLVAASAYLATNAVSAATGAAPRVLTLANNLLARASTDNANGNYVAAVGAYGEAWSLVSL